jgi:hypothetical protein
MWEEQIAKIEKNPIDREGAVHISLDFHLKKGLLRFSTTGQEGIENYQELRMLESKLRVAIEIARCKYNLQNRSIWARIAESFAVTGYRKAMQQ